MKASPPRSARQSLCLLLCTLVGVAASAGIARAGENFSSFLKICGMSFADQNTFDGFPWGGSGGSDPYATLAAHGVNYARIAINVNPPSNPEPWNNQARDLAQATIAKKDGLKVELDVLYSDTTAGAIPAAWKSDWNTATKSGADFDSLATASALESDVYNYTANLVKAFATNGTPLGMIAIGNEINNSVGFIGVPQKHALYYQLIYEGCKAVRDNDSTIGIVLHLNGIGSAEVTECGDLISAKSIYGIPANLSFDCFSFSFHAFDNPLDNPTGSGAEGLQQAFFKENLGGFVNIETGKPVYLMVQETEYPFTTSPETVKGTSFPLKYTACSAFNDCCCGSSPYGTPTYCCDATGAHDYLEAEMTIVAGSVSKLGVGVCTWAGDNVAGWGRNPEPDEYNFALWDSASGALVAETDGTTVMSAFNHTYTLNR